MCVWRFLMLARLPSSTVLSVLTGSGKRGELDTLSLSAMSEGMMVTTLHSLDAAAFWLDR